MAWGFSKGWQVESEMAFSFSRKWQGVVEMAWSFRCGRQWDQKWLGVLVGDDTGIRYEYARYCIRYRIPLIVNESPHEINNKINTHSLQGFSKYIKIKILESYNQNCTIQNSYICNINL